MSGVGLSAVSKELLGKPLDKSMQMSNWEERPLSARQQQYAALVSSWKDCCTPSCTQHYGKGIHQVHCAVGSKPVYVCATTLTLSSSMMVAA